jgi:hypothetical protein
MAAAKINNGPLRPRPANASDHALPSRLRTPPRASSGSMSADRITVKAMRAGTPNAAVSKKIAWFEYATYANITISGTDVILAAAEIQAVAMVLHELVTNAAKHGALSISDGWVTVSWERTPNGHATENLVLAWRELGGPPVTASVPSGYGTTLIRNLVPHELGGKVDVVFPPEGVSCRIEIPLSRSEQR